MESFLAAKCDHIRRIQAKLWDAYEREKILRDELQVLESGPFAGIWSHNFDFVSKEGVVRQYMGLLL